MNNSGRERLTFRVLRSAICLIPVLAHPVQLFVHGDYTCGVLACRWWLLCQVTIWNRDFFHLFFWQRQAGYTASLFMGHRSNFLVPMLTTAQKTLTYVHTEEGNWVLQIWFPWNKACRNSVHCQVMDAVHLIRPLCVTDGCRWLVRRLCGLITKCQECPDSSLLWSMHAHTCME